MKPDIIFEPTRELRELQQTNAISPSYAFDENISGVIFSLDEIFIKRRMDTVGKNEIYFSSVIADDVSKEPIRMTSEIFKKVKKNSLVPLRNKVLYRTEKQDNISRAPSLLSYDIVVMESDEGIRNFGEAVTEITGMREFKKLRSTILSAGAVTVPVASLIVGASDFAFKMLGKLFSMNKDDQVIWITGSFDDFNDDLGVVYNQITQENENARVKFTVKPIE